LSDPERLRLLVLLAKEDYSVSNLAALDNEKIGTVSARLKVLLQANLVTRTKKGQTAIYSIADKHVINLVNNAVEHAFEKH
jgi:DNA-binding transcriptional ArsR family regulator